MKIGTLTGVDNSPVRRDMMAETYEIVSLNWDVEHKRWETEMRGLVRAMGWKALKRLRRPKACWEDMVSDMEIFSWRAWRSLRLRAREPQEIGIWAIADRAVRSSLQGARFQPIGTMGDRSWADSIHNKRNNVKVKSNREDWQLVRVAGDGQDEGDLLSDWSAWKATLGDDEHELVQALEANDIEKVKSVKGVQRRKRALADGFREFRAE
jgi:hypothetical protein